MPEWLLFLQFYQQAITWDLNIYPLIVFFHKYEPFFTKWNCSLFSTTNKDIYILCTLSGLLLFGQHCEFYWVYLLQITGLIVTPFLLCLKVVGPPGTGKTDVAVQIISNVYHNFPEQRTLIVTHSNQVNPPYNQNLCSEAKLFQEFLACSNYISIVY